MTEMWKDIEGYEGKYQVSNLGNVKSLNYRGHGYEKVLTPKTNNSGRLWVELRKPDCVKQMLVHRLVGLAFIPNPLNLPQINHKDENPKNNRVDNLEWCTSTYNIMYSYVRHKERCKNRKPSSKYRRMLDKPIIQMDLEGNEIAWWDCARTITKTNGMSQTSITQCCDGIRHTAYGFRWQYAI